MMPDRRIFLTRNHFTGLRSALRADYHRWRDVTSWLIDCSPTPAVLPAGISIRHGSRGQATL
jgi:hypothetical protein